MADLTVDQEAAAGPAAQRHWWYWRSQAGTVDLMHERPALQALQQAERRQQQQQGQEELQQGDGASAMVLDPESCAEG